MASSFPLLMVLAAFLLQFLPGFYSSTFTIMNNCSYPVWPGIAGTPELSTTGFLLQTGESKSLSVPKSWSGRLWGRTLCIQDSSGKFSCLTGDCGSSTMECSGGGAVPPATLAQFSLNGTGGLQFYAVSLVDGYNLPMMVAPQGGTGGNCSSTGCAADLNKDCPVELKFIDGNNERVACKSVCDAFGDAQYCCSGAYTSPDTCKPSTSSEFFKNDCPQAYSDAHDDGTSTFTCAGADYLITFCPGPFSRIPEKRPWTYEKPPAETKPILHRNRRRLLGKVPDVNVRSPPATSNETSRNLDKEDPPSPPAPSGNGRSHP